MINAVYDAILSTPEAEQSKISLEAIENLTQLITNFAKYGLAIFDYDQINNNFSLTFDDIFI